VAVPLIKDKNAKNILHMHPKLPRGRHLIC